MDINYSLIGSDEFCEQFRDNLDAVMQKALDGDEASQEIVRRCAAHFYGLDHNGGSPVASLVGAIKSIEQNLEFA